MPKAFDDCVASGGKVRTIVPEDGKYMHVCYPVGGGPSVAGEMKTKGANRSMPTKSKPKYKVIKQGK